MFSASVCRETKTYASKQSFTMDRADHQFVGVDAIAIKLHSTKKPANSASLYYRTQ